MYEVRLSCLNKLQLIHNRLVYDTKMKVGVHRFSTTWLCRNFPLEKFIFCK